MDMQAKSSCILTFPLFASQITTWNLHLKFLPTSPLCTASVPPCAVLLKMTTVVSDPRAAIFPAERSELAAGTAFDCREVECALSASFLNVDTTPDSVTAHCTMLPPYTHTHAQTCYLPLAHSPWHEARHVCLCPSIRINIPSPALTFSFSLSSSSPATPLLASLLSVPASDCASSSAVTTHWHWQARIVCVKCQQERRERERERRQEGDGLGQE